MIRLLYPKHGWQPRLSSWPVLPGQAGRGRRWAPQGIPPSPVNTFSFLTPRPPWPATTTHASPGNECKRSPFIAGPRACPLCLPAATAGLSCPFSLPTTPAHRAAVQPCFPSLSNAHAHLVCPPRLPSAPPQHTTSFLLASSALPQAKEGFRLHPPDVNLVKYK